MNGEYALALGAVCGVAGGTLALMALGVWGLPLVLVFTLVGILVGERL